MVVASPPVPGNSGPVALVVAGTGHDSLSAAASAVAAAAAAAGDAASSSL